MGCCDRDWGDKLAGMVKEGLFLNAGLEDEEKHSRYSEQ